MSSQGADGAHCEVPSELWSAAPAAADAVRASCLEQPRLKRTVRNSVQACMEEAPVLPICVGLAKGGMTTELLRKAAAALEAALLGSKGGDNDEACEFSAAESQNVEAIFNSCIEMHAGHIPASAASSLLDRLGYSSRGLAIVETSLTQAEIAGAFLDLREFSRLALLLRDGTAVQASGLAPLSGSPAKALRRSRSHTSLAREFAEPKPHGRVASLRSPLEPLPQRRHCASRGSGRRHLQRCSSACHFDSMIAPATVQIASQPLLC